MTHPAHPRILHVISHLDMGGAENVAISLAEVLHPHFNFTFFAVGGVADNPVGREMAQRLKRLEIPYHSGTAVEFKRGGVVQASLRLHRLIWKLRPDLIHLHTEMPETTFVGAALLGLPPGTRVIRTVHSSRIWPAWRRIGRVVESRLRAADIVGVSAASVQGLRTFQAVQHLPQTPLNRTRVIYNGVRTTLPQTTAAQARAAGRPVQVLYAGRLAQEKGVDLLPGILTVAAGLTSRPAGVTLLGHGPLQEELRAWVQTQQTPWTVRLEPPVPNLAQHLHRFDVLLLPSRFEGLCIMAIEALIAGLPVVGTRVPGLAEVFPPGYPLLSASGDMAALGACLAGAVEQIEEYTAFVAAHRAHTVEHFGLESMAANYSQYYRTELGREGSRR